MLEIIQMEAVVLSIEIFHWVISNKTNLVTVGLWCQSLVQRSHLSCQMLEVIPEFFLLPKIKHKTIQYMILKQYQCLLKAFNIIQQKHILNKTFSLWAVLNFFSMLWIRRLWCVHTSSGWSPCSLNLRGILLRAYLQPLKYILQEQPNEKEAPHISGSLPWQAQVRLQGTEKVNFELQSKLRGTVKMWFL